MKQKKVRKGKKKRNNKNRKATKMCNKQDHFEVPLAMQTFSDF